MLGGWVDGGRSRVIGREGTGTPEMKDGKVMASYNYRVTSTTMDTVQK